MTELSTTMERIRELNDAARKQLASNIATNALDASCELVITCGVAARGWDFVARALAIVRDFSDFTPDDEPYGEHDFGAFDPRRRQAVLEN
jgi:hypothetical protein